MTAHVELVGVTKSFGGAKALSGIDLTVERDSFHALVGENGAGKSTLGRVIAGLHRPSSGDMRVAGEEVGFRGPRDALARGITMVVQERTVVPGMSVLDNVLLNREVGAGAFVDRRAGRRRFDEICDLAGFSVDPKVRAGAPAAGPTTARRDPPGTGTRRRPARPGRGDRSPGTGRGRVVLRASAHAPGPPPDHRLRHPFPRRGRAVRGHCDDPP
ncbi:ATP-binding cassette domain-containing protein [Streptomyces sp. L7]